MSEVKQKVCQKCLKPMALQAQFYQTKDLENYPDGYLDLCKKCFTMHINIHEPSSFIHLMKTLNLPYIESEWNKMVEKYGQNPKTTSTAIFGRYVAKMKLKQYSNYSFKDSEQFVKDQRMKEIMAKAEQLREINKYREDNPNLKLTDLQGIDLSVFAPEDIEKLIAETQQIEDTHNLATSVTESISLYTDLTKEDKQYLIEKWGRTYTIPECIKLEKLFLSMMESYDIRTASHIDYLLKICRISLKIDQALEVNDIDGFNKMTRMYDLLMKSAKFTAQQNSKDKGEDEFTDALGVVVAMCEEQGFIPKYHEERQDIVDITLKDMNEYMRKLIMGDLNLGNMIEGYLNKMSMEQQKEEDEMDDDDDDDIVIINDQLIELEDEDFEDFNKFLEDTSLDVEEEL